ncbi:TetR/AcrR family transcriptional regulator [Sulfurimonas sp. SAG-AH-194-L11]|nr:TetR/AcrR family transcriptional regulator [Sulfurimonas sp. SAG-AH-194-L11]MDF1877144.1 TetR/AcrR family transcriptional regulator [Sulfurimonas sp. SAG-AH-194-L11]
MAIIVDKEQKRKNIALACKEVILENSIRNLSISKLADAAGIGKGTIYEYFENKEDIVFEIVNIMMQKYNEKKKKKLLSVTSTREKVIIFLSFFYTKEESELLQIYKEFVSISLSNPNLSMIDFQEKCSQSYYLWFCSIIESGIEKGELIEDSKALVKGLYSIGEGMFVRNATSNDTALLKKDINEFIDAIFKLIEVK